LYPYSFPYLIIFQQINIMIRSIIILLLLPSLLVSYIPLIPRITRQNLQRTPLSSPTKLYDTNPLKSAFSSFVNEVKQPTLTDPHPCNQRLIQPSKSVVNLPPSSPDRPLPSHDTTVTGELPNGFSYVILPNASPAGRFEVRAGWRQSDSHIGNHYN